MLRCGNRATNKKAMCPTKLDQEMPVLVFILTMHSMPTHYVFHCGLLIVYESRLLLYMLIVTSVCAQ
jgi:hypothetical protein